MKNDNFVVELKWVLLVRNLVKEMLCILLVLCWCLLLFVFNGFVVLNVFGVIVKKEKERKRF